MVILTGRAGETRRTGAVRRTGAARRRVPLVGLVVLGVVAAGVVVRVVTPQGGEHGVLAVTQASEAPTPSPGPLRAPQPRRSPRSRPSPPPRPLPVPEVGMWEELPGGPLEARNEPMGVWTGRELLVWGGAVAAVQGPEQAFVADGAAYDPATGGWRRLAPSPLEGRSGAAVVWTGTEMVVWGGLGAVAHLGDGARYDPVAGVWTPLPDAPLSPRSSASAVWTGREVVVVGGQDNGGPRAEVAAFDPAAGTWRRLPPLPPRGWGSGLGQEAVWTGHRLVVATTGSEGPAGEAVVVAMGAALDGWTVLPSPQETVSGIAVEADRGRVYATVSDVNGRGSSALWFLEPGAETWTATAAGPHTVNAWQDRLVGTGGGVLAVRPDVVGSGAWYHADGDRWERVARQPSRGREGAAGYGQVLVWTGEALLVWGGFDGTAAPATLRALRVSAPG